MEPSVPPTPFPVWIVDIDPDYRHGLNIRSAVGLELRRKSLIIQKDGLKQVIRTAQGRTFYTDREEMLTAVSHFLEERYVKLRNNLYDLKAIIECSDFDTNVLRQCGYHIESEPAVVPDKLIL